MRAPSTAKFLSGLLLGVGDGYWLFCHCAKPEDMSKMCTALIVKVVDDSGVFEMLLGVHLQRCLLQLTNQTPIVKHYNGLRRPSYPGLKVVTGHHVIEEKVH